MTIAQADYTKFTVEWTNGCPAGTLLDFLVYEFEGFSGRTYYDRQSANSLKVDMPGFLLNSANYVYALNSTEIVSHLTHITLAAPPASPIGISPFVQVNPRSIAIGWDEGSVSLPGYPGVLNPVDTAHEVQLSTSALYSSPIVQMSVAEKGNIWLDHITTVGCLTPATTYYARVRAINREGIPTAFVSLGSTVTLPVAPPATDYAWGEDRWELTIVPSDLFEGDVLLFNDTPQIAPLSSQTLSEKISEANSKLGKMGDPLRRPLPRGLVEIQTRRACPSQIDPELGHSATLVFNVDSAGGEVGTGAGSARTETLSFYRLDVDAGIWNKIPSRVEGGKVMATVKELGTLAVMGQSSTSLEDVQTRPNPFRLRDNAGVTFANMAESATLHIYTPSGREVRRLEETDGDGLLVWDGRATSGDLVDPGVYFYTLKSPGDEKRGKVMVLP